MTGYKGAASCFSDCLLSMSLLNCIYLFRKAERQREIEMKEIEIEIIEIYMVIETEREREIAGREKSSTSF